MKQQWQSAFGQMTYGIYVLTTKMDDTINGMIASWVTQVSFRQSLKILDGGLQTWEENNEKK